MKTGQQIQVHKGTFQGKVATITAIGAAQRTGWVEINFGGVGHYWVLAANVTVLEVV